MDREEFKYEKEQFDIIVGYFEVMSKALINIQEILEDINKKV